MRFSNCRLLLKLQISVSFLRSVRFYIGLHFCIFMFSFYYSLPGSSEIKLIKTFSADTDSSASSFEPSAQAVASSIQVETFQDLNVSSPALQRRKGLWCDMTCNCLRTKNTYQLHMLTCVAETVHSPNPWNTKRRQKIFFPVYFTYETVIKSIIFVQRIIELFLDKTKNDFKAFYWCS